MAVKAKPKVEVILPDTDPKKGSVRFETSERPTAVRALYLERTAFAELGSPSAIKVTIEAYEA